MPRKSQFFYPIKIRIALLMAGLFLIFGSCFDDGEVDFDAQLQADLLLIDEYLTTKGLVALRDPEEKIRYVLHVEGTGKSPVDSTCVRATYEGRILDTDQIFAAGTDYSFPMAGDIIEGWKIALPLLQAGDEATIYIPSILAYGPTGIPTEGIEPNKNVLFHFSLKYVGTKYSPTPSPAGTCNQ
jgi:FKBP-type peptidyl-prolyl cis-trans isomerase FkpA